MIYFFLVVSAFGLALVTLMALLLLVCMQALTCSSVKYCLASSAEKVLRFEVFQLTFQLDYVAV